MEELGLMHYIYAVNEAGDTAKTINYFEIILASDESLSQSLTSRHDEEGTNCKQFGKVMATTCSGPHQRQVIFPRAPEHVFSA